MSKFCVHKSSKVYVFGWLMDGMKILFQKENGYILLWIDLFCIIMWEPFGNYTSIHML